MQKKINEDENLKSLQNIVKVSNGLRSTRTATQAPTCLDPRTSVHKPHNSLVHPERAPKEPKTLPENHKHFADLRLKLGDKRVDAADTESLPSDLSQDEWVEIVKYQKDQYDEDKRKEAALGLRKKQQLREVLDR